MLVTSTTGYARFYCAIYIYRLSMSVCFIIKKKILGIYSTGYLILVDLVDLNVGLKYATYPFKFIA